MKKTIIILSALLALVGCSNFNFEISQNSQESQNSQNPQNVRVIDASKVVFNIKVDKINEPSTKGVKTAWEDGDVVYLFFEGNTTQYVKMTYNGSAWSYSPGVGTNYDGLSLVASGDKLSAVYMPGFVIGEATPSYVSDKWTIGTGLGGYILTAEAVEYTVTVTDVTTLNATLSMTAPANMMQVNILSADAGTPASGNEFVLNMTNVKPFTFDGIVPGGAATITEGTANFPLPAYTGKLGTDTKDGYYFWGILADASAGAIDYIFQLVEQNAEKKYAISSKSKTVTGKNLTGPTAIKLSSLTDNGKFVSLGYADCPLWATGAFKDDGSIVDPLVAGDFYKWCYTTPYKDREHGGTTEYYQEYYMGNYATDRDAAYQKSGGKWCMPSGDQFKALKTNSTQTWKKGWTTLGTVGGGTLVTSKANGISMFFAAEGLYNPASAGSLGSPGEYGGYFSTTPSFTVPDRAVFQYFASSAFLIYGLPSDASGNGGDRRSAFNIRPVVYEGTPSSQYFTVAADKKVAFAPGNLVATIKSVDGDGKPTAATWAFHVNQYDMVHVNSTPYPPESGNPQVAEQSFTEGSKIDIFGWSTAATYYGISSSTDPADYSGSFVDWGNAVGSTWRTLTKDEWTYLLTTRTDAAAKYNIGMVCGVKGLIILPDSFSDPNKNHGSDAFAPSTSNPDSITNTEWNVNSYDATGWTAMEASGAAFLPADGYRDGTGIYRIGYKGYYWAATGSGEASARTMFFHNPKDNTADLFVIRPDGSDYRHTARAIRLVRDVE